MVSKSNLWRAWISTTSTFNGWECCKVLKEQGNFYIFSEILHIIAQLCWVLRLHLSIFPHCLCSMLSARRTRLVRNESDWAPLSGQVRKGFSYLVFWAEIWTARSQPSGAGDSLLSALSLSIGGRTYPWWDSLFSSVKLSCTSFHSCFTVILQAVKSHLPSGELWLLSYLWRNSNPFYVSDPLPNFLNMNINFLS